MKHTVYPNGDTISVHRTYVLLLCGKSYPMFRYCALTASATPLVEADIMKQLAFAEKKVFRQSFERPNLSYSTFRTDSKINKIIDILQESSGSSLVYCRSRKRTKEISDLLQLQNIKADFYHAGLSQQDRSRKQEEWINNSIRTMVVPMPLEWVSTNQM